MELIKTEYTDKNLINLLKSNMNSSISLKYESDLMNEIDKYFTTEEQKWYLSNLFMYINYHPTNEYPINLENVFKMIGFANKGNAMKTLKTNFTLDEDYKTSFVPKEKSSWGGSGGEQVMLNIDTFKNLCMLAKTSKGKEIRKYYIKLETILNDIIKKQLRDSEQLLIEQKLLLQDQIDKNKVDKLLERESTLIEMCRKQNVFYICLFCYEEKWYVKFGISEGAVNIKGDVSHRINSHKNEISKELYLVHIIKTDKCKELENKFKIIYSVPLIEKTFTNGENKTEIIELSDKITIEHVIKTANKLSKDLEYKPEISDEITLKQLEISLEKEKTKQLEINLEFKKLELEKLKIQQLNLKQNQYLQILQEPIEPVEPVENPENVLDDQGDEKTQFYNWLNNNVSNNIGSILVWKEVMFKLTERRVGSGISKKYKEYFEDYIKHKYPHMTNIKYKSIRKNEITVRGYLDLSLM